MDAGQDFLDEGLKAHEAEGLGAYSRTDHDASIRDDELNGREPGPAAAGAAAPDHIIGRSRA